MNFFSKLFGQNPKKESQSKTESMVTSPIPTNQVDYAFYAELVGAITESDALKADLKSKLKKAFDDPKSFFDEHDEFSLSSRGLTYPADVAKTQKFVLIDTLIENDQMAEVDWKEAEDEIRFTINRILKVKNYDFHLSEEDKYEESTFEIIESINSDELLQAGYSLEILDIDSDSYVFTIVPLSKQKEVTRMFEKLR